MSQQTPPVSALEALAAAGDTDFPNLIAAREKTLADLPTRIEALGGVKSDEDVAVGLMGSWGRGEVTSGSDDDFMILIKGPYREGSSPGIDDVSRVLGDDDRAPGPEAIFGLPVSGQDLIEKIGLDEDSNRNLTRRMLLVLESRPVINDAVWFETKAAVINGYLDAALKPYRPPRFFLNDLVRYWRTIAVDFEAKHRSRAGKGWGLRNAKLRISRKLLFASGLLPLLECHDFDLDQIPGHVHNSFELLPIDRVAEAFIRYDQIDAGVRTVAAYDEFLAALDDSAFRQALGDLAAEDAELSDEFQEAARLGREVQAGLLALLFESDKLYPLVREFAIF